MLEVLKGKQRFINEGSKAVNMFSKFPGPDGNYYAQLVKITWTQEAKTQAPVCRFAFVTIANVEDNSTEWGACPVRIQFYLRDSAKSTEKDAWERLYTQGYQALGCLTAQWENLVDPVTGRKVPVMETLVAETERLVSERPCVVLSVTQNPKDIRYQNINIREVLKADALEHFTKPKMEIDEDDLNTDEDEGVDTIPDTSDDEAPDFTPILLSAKEALLPLDMAGVIEQGKASELDLDFDTLSSGKLEDARRVVLVAYIEKSGYNPEDYDLSFDNIVPGTVETTIVGDDDDKERTKARIRELTSAMDDGNGTEAQFNENGEIIGQIFSEALGETGNDVAAASTDGPSSAEEEELLEDEEEELVYEMDKDEAEAQAKKERLLSHLSGLDRLGQAKFIKTHSPEAKIMKSTTDEAMLQWAVDVGMTLETLPF